MNGFHRPTPPLLDGAQPGAPGVAYDCEQDLNPAGNPTFAQSREINQRLLASFPIGTPSERLRRSLAQQGFALQGHCSRDRTISWARFRGGARAIVRVYWRKDEAGQIVWEIGQMGKLP